MDYLILENVSKSYGDKLLFENLSLKITEGQRIAIVARNGSGKSTLLKIIAGEEAAEGENARVEVHKKIRVGYLNQEPNLEEHLTIIDTLLGADDPKAQAYKEYYNALLKDDKKELEHAVAKMDDFKAWDFEATVKTLLSKLNMDDLDLTIKNLSGGQKKRVALAKLIVENPDFLILDEPTNHLDLDMIEWLEEYLSKTATTILMVTHDRYFLENVCNTILELDHGRIHTYRGNYSEFLEKKVAREENEAVVQDKNKKLLSKELDWVRRMPKARGTKSKSRVQSFQELKQEVNSFKTAGTVQLDFKTERLGSKIVEAQYISKNYGDKVILDEFHYNFKKGDRVGIIGPNGIGKTTFIKLLTKEIRPDGGKVVVGGTIKFGYYTQEGFTGLDLNKRLIDVVTDIAEYIPLDKGLKMTAASLCERFMFERKQQQVYVSQLSGGERRRLYLLTVLMQNPNFLILDEPTNDLDIMTLNVLEDFLISYPGVLLVITHDRYFMDKIVDHLFIFQGKGKVKDFNGTYTDYKKREAEFILKDDDAGGDQAPKEEKPGLTREQQKEIRRLEKKMEKLQGRQKQIEDAFLKDPMMEVEQMTKLSKEKEQIEEELETVEMEWLELADLE